MHSPHDSDVALIGTGIAPLIAASHLISQGKTVLVLNPDYDFFLEDSELPLDPLLPLAGALTPERLLAQDAERVLEELRPPFPGAVETWSSASGTHEGFHDPQAPHVRQRLRLWIARDAEPWSHLEDAYVRASDAGLNPRILEGLQAVKRFPGFSSSVDSYRGLWVPKICDVDVSRYRNGVLEFVRERLGAARFVVAAAQIEPMPGGVRFYSGGKPFASRVHERILVFWTPRMTPWILGQAKRAEMEPRLPAGVRFWEQWSLISRDELDPEVIGTYSNLVVWAEVEGRPHSGLDRLSVLRSGPLLAAGEATTASEALNAWASGESMSALSSLCYDFMKWSRFSVRSMKARAIFEWAEPVGGASAPWELEGLEPSMRIIPRCDGPLVDVVRTAREAIA